MAVNKPEKPSVTLPNEFGGTKTAYTETQISDGYEDGIPQIVDGGNLNYSLNGIFENNQYNRVVTDYLRDMPVGDSPIVNSNGQLDYAELQGKLTAGDNITITGNTISAYQHNFSDIKPVVETYSNGTSWYRIYSDGWVEQGGFVSSVSGDYTVNFLKPFADTNYTILKTMSTNSTGGSVQYKQFAFFSRTTSSATTTTAAADFSWYACGYGA